MSLNAAFLKCGHKTGWLVEPFHTTFLLVFVPIVFDERSTRGHFLSLKKHYYESTFFTLRPAHSTTNLTNEGQTQFYPVQMEIALQIASQYPINPIAFLILVRTF
jgi:hypothetical protein